MGHFPLESHLEPRHGVVPGQGHVVLLVFGQSSDLDGVVQDGPDLRVVCDELVNKDHLAVIVIE